MLDQAVAVNADGGTTPAASLMPFYQGKEKVKTFIIVTDEEENGRCQNMWYVYFHFQLSAFPLNESECMSKTIAFGTSNTILS